MYSNQAKEEGRMRRRRKGATTLQSPSMDLLSATTNPAISSSSTPPVLSPCNSAHMERSSPSPLINYASPRIDASEVHSCVVCHQISPFTLGNSPTIVGVNPFENQEFLSGSVLPLNTVEWTLCRHYKYGQWDSAFQTEQSLRHHERRPKHSKLKISQRILAGSFDSRLA